MNGKVFLKSSSEMVWVEVTDVKVTMSLVALGVGAGVAAEDSDAGLLDSEPSDEAVVEEAPSLLPGRLLELNLFRGNDFH